MRRFFTAAAVAAVIVLTASATYSSVCRFSTSTSVHITGVSYCKDRSRVTYHIITDCPCRVQGSVGADGTNAIFSSNIVYGDPTSLVEINQLAPGAIATVYDLHLDCNEDYRVEVSCSSDGRPPAIFWYDQGTCGADCSSPPPEVEE